MILAELQKEIRNTVPGIIERLNDRTLLVREASVNALSELAKHGMTGLMRRPHF